MQKITPFLWFDHQAEEAVNFYVSLFPNSKTTDIQRYNEESSKASGQPAGSVNWCSFELSGQKFGALNGGDYYKITPATSFFVSCDSEEEIDTLWSKFSEGAQIMMPFQEYPFSKKFGWLADKFGVSWQLNLDPRKQKITPCLMFVGDQHGKAEEAMKLYTSIFKNANIDMIARYEAGEMDPAVGTIKHSEFTLDGYSMMAMDSSMPHAFKFTGGISFLVNCETQDEVDEFCSKLIEGGGEQQQCGWLTDKFGVVWQIVPTILSKLLGDPDPVKAQRVMRAMLEMYKLNIAELQKAYDGE